MPTGRETTPCTYCMANNDMHRQKCWRCGHTLPFSVGLDGKTKSNTQTDSGKLTRAELERLLQHEVTEKNGGGTEADPTSEAAPSGPSYLRRIRKQWLWLQRRRSDPPEPEK